MDPRWFSGSCTQSFNDVWVGGFELVFACQCDVSLHVLQVHENDFPGSSLVTADSIDIRKCIDESNGPFGMQNVSPTARFPSGT